jgi:SAM-dependent methyltransferase
MSHDSAGKREPSAQITAYGMDGYGRAILDNLEGSHNYHRYVAGKFLPYLGDVNVEFGAGTGAISQYVPRRTQLVLSDISPSNCEKLASKFHGRADVSIVQGSLDDVSDSVMGGADAVYSSNVLEHVEDDRALAAAAIGRMKPGARFIAVVPAMKLLYSQVDRSLGHFRRYTGRHANALASALPDARLIRARYFNPVGALGWLVKYRLMKSRVISEEDSRLVDAVIPYLQWLDVLRLPLGQSMLIVLEKR